MGYGGNKGAVAISFSLFRRRLVLLSSHFAAHQVRRRGFAACCCRPALAALPAYVLGVLIYVQA
jgi:hypothetical protein